jgi:hypothetical protein
LRKSPRFAKNPIFYGVFEQLPSSTIAFSDFDPVANPLIWAAPQLFFDFSTVFSAIVRRAILPKLRDF